MEIEYRIKPVTRYIVTRAYNADAGGDNPRIACATQVTERGEYPNADKAYEVAYALCKLDHEISGYSPFDERIQYPLHPVPGRALAPGQIAFDDTP